MFTGITDLGGLILVDVLDIIYDGCGCIFICAPVYDPRDIDRLADDGCPHYDE